jgi:hypothetical protein
VPQQLLAHTWIDQTDKQIFTAEELALAEGVSISTVHNWVNAGLFGDGWYRAGKAYRITRDGVVRFHVNSRRRRKP